MAEQGVNNPSALEMRKYIVPIQTQDARAYFDCNPCAEVLEVAVATCVNLVPKDPGAGHCRPCLRVVQMDWKSDRRAYALVLSASDALLLADHLRSTVEEIQKKEAL